MNEDFPILIFECHHTRQITPAYARMVAVGTNVWCPSCKKVRKVTNKLIPSK